MNIFGIKITLLQSIREKNSIQRISNDTLIVLKMYVHIIQSEKRHIKSFLTKSAHVVTFCDNSLGTSQSSSG